MTLAEENSCAIIGGLLLIGIFMAGILIGLNI